MGCANALAPPGPIVPVAHKLITHDENLTIKMNEPMKQDRSHQGLTLNGIAYHIVNAILLWEKGKDNDIYGTRNDCQLVINHLIRKYHDRLEAEKHIVTDYTPQATEARNKGGKVIKEHAIPVACVMRELIDRQCMALKGDLDTLVPEVEAILQASAGRRYVSADEDRALIEFVDKMPAGHERYRWDDPWVRHTAVGIPFALKGTMDPQREAEIVKRALEPTLTENEIAVLYHMLRCEGGTQPSLDAMEQRIRSDYPNVARTKLGLKQDPATSVLAVYFKNLSEHFDLSGNKVKNGVKPGGDARGGRSVLSRYLSYKNPQNIGTQITIVKTTANSELEVIVEYYRTNQRTSNFRRAESFTFEAFEAAAALYESYLDQLHVPRKIA